MNQIEFEEGECKTFDQRVVIGCWAPHLSATAWLMCVN